MKKITVMKVVTILLLSATSAMAAGPVDLDAGLGLHSKYVWRGMTVTPDLVVQPEFAANVLGIGFGFWGNIDTSDINDTEWQLNEVDWTLSYELSLPLVELGAGLIYYDLRGGIGADTSEFYVSGQVNVLLSPGLAVYFDLDEYKGTHARASVAHGSELNEYLDWELSAELGWGSEGYVNGYFPRADVTSSAGFTDALVSLGLPWHPVPFITVTPHASWAALLDDAKSAEVYDKDVFFYGLTAMFSF
ncbi:hypothetical protein DRQ50_10050 [bacterium]|nr:MAG: hypothetical protein DRQ50_10050 [bacterium]